MKDHLGRAIGPTRLRKVGKHLAAEMEPFREQCQFEQLQRWLVEAWKTNARSIVLSVDAVSLGIAPFGHFEMASVATLTPLRELLGWGSPKRIINRFVGVRNVTKKLRNARGDLW